MPATVRLLARTATRRRVAAAGADECRACPRSWATACTSASSSRARSARCSALDDVSLEVPAGTLTALVGPDGAGKTTLLRLAAGLMRADQGELQVLGIDVAADPQAVQDRISYMPQRFGLYEDLSVQENLDLYADLHGVPQAERARALCAADGDDRPRPLHRAPRRQALRRHEAEAGPGLHAGALARAAAARRAHRGRRPAVAPRAVGDRAAAGRRRAAQRCSSAPPTSTRPSAAHRSSCCTRAGCSRRARRRRLRDKARDLCFIATPPQGEPRAHAAGAAARCAGTPSSMPCRRAARCASSASPRPTRDALARAARRRPLPSPCPRASKTASWCCCAPSSSRRARHRARRPPASHRSRGERRRKP